MSTKKKTIDDYKEGVFDTVFGLLGPGDPRTQYLSSPVVRRLLVYTALNFDIDDNANKEIIKTLFGNGQPQLGVRDTDLYNA